MNEGRRVLTGEAILNGVATIGYGEHERIKSGRKEGAHSRAESADGAIDGVIGDVIDDLLEALVRQHSRLVYRIAYAVLRQHHDAEDATQEIFLRVLRYNSKLAAVEDTKTWIAQIAWRVAVDRSMHNRRTREIPLQDPAQPIVEVASSEAAADATVQGTQVSAILEQLISALPDKLRQPLVLSTIEEMSPREVAVTLGINEAAVRSRVFRARQILREKLEQRTARK